MQPGPSAISVSIAAFEFKTHHIESACSMNQALIQVHYFAQSNLRNTDTTVTYVLQIIILVLNIFVAFIPCLAPTTIWKPVSVGAHSGILHGNMWY